MENIEAMLCAYVEGDLDATGRAQIEKHLEDHPQHRKLLEELMAMREMVRSLPTAQAPLDVGDSLRQKVERSMLLDSTAAAPARERTDRWPQIFGIAAIFLLVSSLCFILFRALGPTWKPAVFTQNMAVNKNPGLVLPEETVVPRDTSEDSATSRPAISPNVIAAESPAAEQEVSKIAAAQIPQPPPATVLIGSAASGSVAPPTTQPVASQLASNQFGSQLNSGQAVVNEDISSIRRRLENSGYGIAGGQASAGPMLVVVDSNNVSSTKAQMAQFFNNNPGMSYTAVPAEPQMNQSATTMPAAALVAAQSSTLRNSLDKVNVADAANISGDLYVAHGLTAEQADALRQTLTLPAPGSQVQVSVQSAAALATTQPSALGTPIIIPTDGKGIPTTQSVEMMNQVMNDAGNSTTQPSPAFNASRIGATLQHQNSLLSVDAVILLRNAPTTQPSQIPMEKLIPLAPSTRP